MPPRPVLAVSFDFGQTLAELDTDLLARRLAERACVADAAALEAAVPAAWQTYDRAIRAGEGGHPWKTLMRALLERAGVRGDVAAAVDWLWDQQPVRNLWRRPIAGMIEVVKALRVPVAVVSNSEGKLAELADELGWRELFVCIADSGKLGLEKPGREIFDWAAARMGVPVEGLVHVGDSWAADVVGAKAAGARAVWFRREGAEGAEDADVPVCNTAAGLRQVLRELGLAISI